MSAASSPPIARRHWLPNWDQHLFYYGVVLKNAVEFIIYVIAVIVIFNSIPKLRDYGTALFAGAGVLAAHTTLPVLGVPMRSEALNGLDSLLATVQMPGGIPVGTLAIGKPGAVNAALFAVAILANSRPELRKKLHEFREAQEAKIRATKL